MPAKLYYTAPTDELFEELKKEALNIWTNLPDAHPSYVEEKVSRIQNIKNISDNFMYIVAMFDDSNQRKLASVLSEACREAVRVRLVDGGQPSQYIYF